MAQNRGGERVARKKKTGFDAEAAKKMTASEVRAYLDDREAKFAEEYLKDLNGTQAAIRAGYKPGKDNASAAVQASRLLHDERVRAYRSALIRESVDDECLSRESVVLKIIEIYRRCMAAVPVMEWDSNAKTWKESGTWQFNARGAMKALEMLSKLLGFEAPVKIETVGGIEKLLAELDGGKTY